MFSRFIFWPWFAGLTFLVAGLIAVRKELPAARGLDKLLALGRVFVAASLALFGAERSALLPDVPTTAELGLPDVVMENWYGVFLPVGTPAAVHDKLEKALFAVVALPAVKERFATQGMHGTLGSAAFKARLAMEFPYWQSTIAKLGIKAE